MAASDTRTLSVYAREVGRYADLTADAAADPQLDAFLSALPAAARVLDLGCGPGHAAAEMARRGFRVEASDACPEMVALAAGQPGVAARLASFEELDARARYDGVWASFSLLHAPRAEMPAHLARLKRALKPGGLLALGLKTGAGEVRDRLGRFYAYYGVAEIHALLSRAGFAVAGTVEGSGAGLDGTVAPWMVVTARA